ncbi:hypothetical protein KJA15_03735 [Patescibacteria group bacterium]|nr:hypothetical protein [Patescibacteria group bacterium]
MAFEKFEKKFERKMFKGDWTCADCGAKITELPFQPDSDRPIYCRECHRKKRARFQR